jgi:exopolyphosphatase/guanosine-5'-triphosphate,3'-diphosphate pyrophosphatase
MGASGVDAGSPTPSGVVPRWEWRTFGDRFDVADDLLGGLTPDRQRSNDELYFLSLHSDASVKVRDGLADVKHLLRVDDDGLELWSPVLKAEFPLPADDVQVVLTTLGVESSPRQQSYSVDELVRQLIEPHADLAAVEVHKDRTHYTFDGCIVESTVVSSGGRVTRSLAVESPDPRLVSSVVRSLGLTGQRNTCVARGLKRLVGFGAERYAVIDVGTNSVKFHVGERRPDGSRHTLVDRAEMTRLGEGQADSGELADHAIARTVDAIDGMVAEARQLGALEVVAVGTAGLRRAPNRAQLADAVRARADVVVEVISGEEEARLAYLAATSSLAAARGQLVVFDSGGGSTQFTFGRDDQVDERFSLDVGAVRIAERFGLGGAVSTATLDHVLGALSAELDRLGGRPTPDAVVAIGGTSTNLAAVKHGLVRYDPERVHGTVIDVGELDRQIETYRTRSADDRRAIPGLQPARAEVILGGACIVRAVLAKLGTQSMTVSDRGLRHGVVLARTGG